MHTDDGEKQYWETQDVYNNINIDHLPKEHFEKLYSYRLSTENKERVQNLFG